MGFFNQICIIFGKSQYYGKKHIPVLKETDTSVGKKLIWVPNMTIKFNFKNASKNVKFYYCFNRGKGCGGFALYDIVKNEFRVYKQCDFNINHDNINFEKFEKLYLQNQLNLVDMSLKKYQR